MKKQDKNKKKTIGLVLAAVVALVIIALLIGNGLRQRPNVDAGNTTAPAGPTASGSVPSSPAVTTAPATTVTTAPPPTVPENTNIMVITHSWRPF